MNTSVLKHAAIVLFSAGLSGIAAAAPQSWHQPTFHDVPDTRTVEQARADTLAFLAESRGRFANGEATVDLPTAAELNVSREQVRAELAQAQRLGLITHGEANVFAYAPGQPAPLQALYEPRA
jgi:hypothetical protein